MDTTPMLKQYTTLSENKLEHTLVQELVNDVKKTIQRSQENADLVVNALTAKAGAKFEVAASNLAQMMGTPSTIRKHWGPFIDQALMLLPSEHVPTLTMVATTSTLDPREAEVNELRAELHRARENEAQADLELEGAQKKTLELEEKLAQYEAAARGTDQALASHSLEVDHLKAELAGLKARAEDAETELLTLKKKKK